MFLLNCECHLLLGVILGLGCWYFVPSVPESQYEVSEQGPSVLVFFTDWKVMMLLGVKALHLFRSFTLFLTYKPQSTVIKVFTPIECVYKIILDWITGVGLDYYWSWTGTGLDFFTALRSQFICPAFFFCFLYLFCKHVIN
jgi:hypothetical protein